MAPARAQQDSDYNPLDYNLQHIRLGLLAQRRSKHIHPQTGVEKAFGDALRDVRQTRNISQQELAFASDLDRTYVSLIERGIQSPTLRTIFAICTALNILPSALIKEMESRMK